MLEHLTSILNDIDLLLNDGNYKFDNKNVNIIKKNLQSFKEGLEKSNDVLLIDLSKVKETSSLIYELNTANSFSTLTDHMSNELYAFEFLLQEELKRKEV
ncbi:MAG: hypothetical protein PHS98_04745 [Bacilli bacterium]|nr:hypothetical protein [Bacilli bacterium]